MRVSKSCSGVTGRSHLNLRVRITDQFLSDVHFCFINLTGTGMTKTQVGQKQCKGKTFFHRFLVKKVDF